VSLWEQWWDYLPLFWDGLLVAAQLTVCTVILAVALGGVLAACKMSRHSVLSAPAALYITLIRATPLLLIVFFVYFGLGELGVLLPAFWAGVIALGSFHGAIFAEIFRGGIQSVDRGQWEAADALGLGPVQRLRRIVLPQSFLPIILPSTNTVADVIKDTSLVFVLGVPELTAAAAEAAGQTYEPLQMYGLAAIFYFALYLLFSRVLSRWELHVARRRN
jgi:polar amino acid transport system permease protein